MVSALTQRYKSKSRYPFSTFHMHCFAHRALGPNCCLTKENCDMKLTGQIIFMVPFFIVVVSLFLVFDRGL